MKASGRLCCVNRDHRHRRLDRTVQVKLGVVAVDLVDEVGTLQQLSMTVGAVDRVAAPMAGLPRLGFDGLMMTRHDSQHSGRLAVTSVTFDPLTGFRPRATVHRSGLDG